MNSFLAPLSAVILGIGTGATCVAVAEAVQGHDAAAKVWWNIGTSTLLTGCLTTATAAKLEQLSRRPRSR